MFTRGGKFQSQRKMWGRSLGISARNSPQIRWTFCRYCNLSVSNRLIAFVRWPTRDMLQTKKKRCKQKRNAANKKETLQTKKKRCKQKRNAANKNERCKLKSTLQIKNENCNLKMYAANNRNAVNKKRTLQIKNERCKQETNAANKKEHIMRAHSVKGTG